MGESIEAVRCVNGINKMQLCIIKWLMILCGLLIILLAGTNMAWLYVANQYEYVTYEQENTDGINNVNLGEMGDVLNGKTSSENSN